MKFKKIGSLLCVAALSFTMAACGNEAKKMEEPHQTAKENSEAVKDASKDTADKTDKTDTSAKEGENKTGDTTANTTNSDSNVGNAFKNAKSGVVQEYKGAELSALRMPESKDDPLVVDVRMPDEYMEGHLKTAVNVPLAEIKKDPTVLKYYKDKPVILYCNTGNQSNQAADILVKAGYTNITNAEGVKNYKYDLVKGYTNLTIDQFLAKSKDKNVILIDTRKAEDFNKGHVGNALNIQAADLEKNLDKLSKDKDIVIYGDKGYAGLDMIKTLADKGFTKIYNGIVWVADDKLF